MVKHYAMQKVSKRDHGRLVPSSGQSVQIMDDHVLTTCPAAAAAVAAGAAGAAGAKLMGACL